MWADNETDIDLLGFDYLVDSLEILLTEPRLLPVTVGVTGDWGSGKSSLMGMGRERLDTSENEGKFVCVSFSPWRFEDYAHIKTALMAAVVDAIADRLDEDKNLAERAGEQMGKVKRLLAEMGLIRTGAAAGAMGLGAGAEEAAVAGAVADAVAKSDLGEPIEPERAFETVAHFHAEFEELVVKLGDDIQAIVVFIDDMDRCATPTIIETFEAIRLFLHAPRTAYVIGAHAPIIEAALEGRYPARLEGDAKIGLHYLEKMLQNGVSIPPLSEAEAETYINLLFSELHTSGEQFEQLRRAAGEQRAKNQLAVAMNEGIAREAIGDIPEALAQSLELAERIGPVLARGLRGNPRQIKRFLNKLLLRQRTAGRRGIELDPDKLAKLMILEELYTADFERLFQWQLDAEGAPEQLKIAEQLARGEKVKDPPADVQGWIMRPNIRDWVLLEPSLAGEPLGSYFTFSRDKLDAPVRSGALAPALQELLARLTSEADPIRAKAVAEANELEEGGLTELAPALLRTASRDLGGEAMKASIELAAINPSVADALFTVLEEIPPRRMRRNLVLQLRLKFPEDDRLKGLMDTWHEKGSDAVKKAVEQARTQT